MAKSTESLRAEAVQVPVSSQTEDKAHSKENMIHFSMSNPPAFIPTLAPGYGQYVNGSFFKKALSLMNKPPGGSFSDLL